MRSASHGANIGVWRRWQSTLDSDRPVSRGRGVERRRAAAARGALSYPGVARGRPRSPADRGNARTTSRATDHVHRLGRVDRGSRGLAAGHAGQLMSKNDEAGQLRGDTAGDQLMGKNDKGELQ